MTTKTIPSIEQYRSAFETARALKHPHVDAFMLGNKLTEPPIEDMEAAARVLACPVKVNPPCWQHGRLVFGLAVKRLSALAPDEKVFMLDIGTAKGFSALMMQWALDFAGNAGTRVISADVISPTSRERRNTVLEAERGGWLTLEETLDAWPEARQITFCGLSAVNLILDLIGRGRRIAFAFVDGKHSYSAVSEELNLIAGQQKVGDMILLDDLQVPGVRQAMSEQLPRERYAKAFITAVPEQRVYAYARRWA